MTKDKARSDNACTHRPWAECWCVLTTRRSRNNTEANQRLVPETLYPHFVWQRSVSVTPTGGSKGFTHLDVSEAGYRCRVIWQPAPKLQRRQLLQILRTAFSALRCEAPQLCTDGVKPRCSFELTYAGILCLSAPHLLTLEGLYAGAQNDSMGHFALPLKITCKSKGLFEFRPQRLRSGDDRGQNKLRARCERPNLPLFGGGSTRSRYIRLCIWEITGTTHALSGKCKHSPFSALERSAMCCHFISE